VKLVFCLFFSGLFRAAISCAALSLQLSFLFWTIYSPKTYLERGDLKLISFALFAEIV
jgi:hypothetical protein